MWDIKPYDDLGNCFNAADPEIGVLDRSIDHPKLQMRAGPTIIQIDLEWSETHYRARAVHGYYPKSRGGYARSPGWDDPLKVILKADGSLEVDGRADALEDAVMTADHHYFQKISIQVADPAKSTYGQLLKILDAIHCERDYWTIWVNDIRLQYPNLWLPLVELENPFSKITNPKCDMNDPAQLQRLQKDAKERMKWFLQVWLIGRLDTPMTTVLEHLKALNDLNLGVGFLEPLPPRKRGG